MSWIPGKGETVFHSLSVLTAAVRERLDSFGMTDNSLTAPEPPESIDHVKTCMEKLRNDIMMLLWYSLNPYRFGSWASFTPFEGVSHRNPENTIAILNRELPLLDCDWNALLLLPPPRKIADHRFISACGELLDKVILWRSPEWKAYGPNVLGVDARLFYKDLRYDGQFDADQWQREGSFSVRVGRNSILVRYDMIAKWSRGESLIFSENHRFLNNGPIRFSGNWETKYSVTAVEEKRSAVSERREFAGETQIARWSGDISEEILFPFPASLVQEIKANTDDSEYSYHHLTCRILPENSAFLTRANMPALNYSYKD